ncbi:unnamed protein product [Euphydryas editha]|uniref:Unconventional prefoldin RPB5 interactor n=1 Tax=Euphydryas editha TaxID=104508 RepID=A0AAU9UZI8_EUPED|nr:unnamed protein product [Euphydryas editha]
MSFLSDIFKKSLIENDKNIRFWEQYLQNLEALDLSVYSEKLKVPILVPIGNRILFRGALQHTNEVTVALGADYFTKCSIKQAEVLKQHRIKDAKLKLEAYNKEKDYLESQMSFGKENVFNNTGQDIIETYTEEEDKAWRKQHREKVKQYNQSKGKKQETVQDGVTDDDLWLRLEELELQEELENELENTIETEENKAESEDNGFDSCIIKENDISNTLLENEKQEPHIIHTFPKQTSKIKLMQQVIEGQKFLETKLTEMRNRQRVQIKTEDDLLSRLDEIEQLDELEDEMDRLYDVIDEMDVKQIEAAPKIKKSITFADEDSETLEITFKHSDVEPSKEPYQPNKGITKPSDIYDVYSNLFTNETMSILRKSKYDIDLNVENNNFIFEEPQPVMREVKKPEKQTIHIKDVKEMTDQNQIKVDSDNRPTSLFKRRRQQKN